MKSIWRGTLAVGAQMAEEFEAEIVITDDGEPRILKHDGLRTDAVSPHQVRGDYWLKAIAALAQK